MHFSVSAGAPASRHRSAYVMNATSKKTALITGITGQDGAYLAEFLLAKGYDVHGIKRRTSLFNTDRIDHLYQDPHVTSRRFILHYGDMTDSSSLVHETPTAEPYNTYNALAKTRAELKELMPQ